MVPTLNFPALASYGEYLKDEDVDDDIDIPETPYVECHDDDSDSPTGSSDEEGE